jgi:acetyl/propionyl-CoA carboxylase alpha subunit
MVTGLDLVEQQLTIAAGEGMNVPTRLTFKGAAIECRINAEDASANFAPSIGRIGMLRLPGGPGIRVDTALYEGYEVPEFYDSLLAKVISWGTDLEHARRRMLVALRELKISGISTTTPFHIDVLSHQRFREWSLRTDFLETNRVVATFSQRSIQERRAALEEAAAVTAAAMAVGASLRGNSENPPTIPKGPRPGSVKNATGGRTGVSMDSWSRGRFFDAL